MNVEFAARHFDLEDKLRAYAERRLGKVARFLEEPIEIRLTLEDEEHRKTAEVHASHRFGSLHAKEETGDLKEAIRQAVDKVEKQARRSREKAKGKKRRGGKAKARLTESAWPVDVLAAESLAGDGQPRVIKSAEFPIKPMSLEEASLALRDSRNDFVVYRDAESDRVHVLYKRHDQNYGLIAPEG